MLVLDVGIVRAVDAARRVDGGPRGERAPEGIVCEAIGLGSGLGVRPRLRLGVGQSGLGFGLEGVACEVDLHGAEGLPLEKGGDQAIEPVVLQLQRLEPQLEVAELRRDRAAHQVVTRIVSFQMLHEKTRVGRAGGAEVRL